MLLRGLSNKEGSDKEETEEIEIITMKKEYPIDISFDKESKLVTN